ncbi:hypothetical protein [Nostoc sp. ChiSLP03a]|nr:hypothetical protein [Nostoc sp. ChiSLP03a]
MAEYGLEEKFGGSLKLPFLVANKLLDKLKMKTYGYIVENLSIEGCLSL